MMDRNIQTFIFKILFAAGLMALMAWIVFTFLIPDQYLPVLPWMLVFFAVVAIATYAWQVKLSKKKLGQFTRSSMLISMLRLMLYSIFAFAYLAVHQSNVAVFVVSLVIVYSIFTVLEVYDMARIVKSK